MQICQMVRWDSRQDWMTARHRVERLQMLARSVSEGNVCRILDGALIRSSTVLFYLKVFGSLCAQSHLRNEGTTGASGKVFGSL